MSVSSVRRWGTGVVMAGGAVLAATPLGLGGAHATTDDDALDTTAGSTNYADLSDAAASNTMTGSDPLATATTNFTDANNLFGDGSAVLGNATLTQFLTTQTQLQANILGSLSELQSAENTIMTHAGPLSSLIDPLFFEPLNQGWGDASEALLNADQTYAGLVAHGSIPEAEFFTLPLRGTDLVWLPGLSFATDFVDVMAGFF